MGQFYRVLTLVCAFAVACQAQAKLDMTLRSRTAVNKDKDLYAVVEKAAAWDASKTAVIICDMWDKHWCDKATERGGPIAAKIDQLARHVRSQGGFIVHAPSDTMKFYENTPQRKLAQTAAKVEPPVPIQRWCYIDEKTEGKLPIDDSDGGCDCEPFVPNPKGGPYPWTRQHPAIAVMDNDAVSESGQEIFNLFSA